MQRALAEVIEVQKIKKIKENNFHIVKLRCKVKIKEPASKGFKLPPYVKGKVRWITRQDVVPWEVKVGDKIILTPDEVRLFLPNIEGDLNFDGYNEGMIENKFLKAIILPHFGAKIGNLIYKPKGEDKFRLILQYGEDESLDMGGIDDYIEPKPPGDLWNADFKHKGDNVYKYNKKGIEITKSFDALSEMPILLHKVNIKTKKKKEINFWQRILFKIDDNWWENIVLIPTKEKLHRKRYVKFFYPWRTKNRYYGLKIGAFLFANNNGCLMWATKPEKVQYISIHNELFTFNVASYTVPKELKKGEEVKYECIWCIGETYKVNSSTIAIGARAILETNKVLFSVVARSEKNLKHIKIYWHNGKDEIPLKRISLGEAGEVLVGKKIIAIGKNEDIKLET